MFKNSEESESDTIFIIRAYGYMSYAQYLKEKKNLSEDQIKTKIVDMFTKFLKDLSNKDKAIEFLIKTYNLTMKNSEINDRTTVFDNWKETSNEIQSKIENNFKMGI